MANGRNKARRQPKAQRTNPAPSKRGNKASPTPEPVEDRPRPRPQPIGTWKKAMANSSTIDNEVGEFDVEQAAAALTSMKQPPSLFRTVVDKSLRITPKEREELDKFQRDEETQALEAEQKSLDNFGSGSEGAGDGDSNDEGDEIGEEEGYDIKFEVPYKNATHQFVLKSSTSFAKFLTTVASKMETRISLLSQLGYIPSWIPRAQKPLPKLLEDEESYEAMMDDIDEYIEACKAKNNGKGKVKTYLIRLLDTSESGDSQAASNKLKPKKSQAKESGKPAAPVEETEEQEHKLIKQILQIHACAEHNGKACYIKSSGSHYQYTHEDLLIWVTLVRRHHVDLNKPPTKLGLDDKSEKQSTVRGRAAKAEAAEGFGAYPSPQNPWAQMAPPPAPWMYGGMPPWMMMLPQVPTMQQSGLLLVAGPTMPAVAPPLQDTMRQTHVHRATDPAPLSSPSVTPKKRGAEELFFPVRYPAVRNWLASLDSDEERGQDRLDYAQHVDQFASAGLIRLDDVLATRSPEKLQQLTQVNWGTANRLMTYAKQDRDNLIADGKRLRRD